MPSEIMDAEQQVAKTKQQFQHSLQLAGETGSRLVTELRKKATPSLLVAVAVGGVAVAGTAFWIARRQPRRLRRSNPSSPSGTLARSVGMWLLRAAALRAAAMVAAKLNQAAPPELPSEVAAG